MLSSHRSGFAALLLALFMLPLLCACGGGGGGSSQDIPSSTTDSGVIAQSTDAEAVQSASQSLTATELLGANSGTDSVTTDLSLPALGRYETTIHWQSSDAQLIANDGTVTRPHHSDGDRSAVLTARFTRGDASSQRQYIFTVKAVSQDDFDALTADLNLLDFNSIRGENLAPLELRTNLLLPLNAPNGSEITWVSSAPGHLAADGNLTRPTFSDGDLSLTLSATLRNGGATGSRSFSLRILALPPNDTETVFADADWLVFDVIRAENRGPASIVSDLLLPESAPSGSTLTWSSSDSAISPTGQVTRPESGNVGVTLSARIERGSIQELKEFELVVLGPPPTVDYTAPAEGAGVFHLETPETDIGDASVSCTLDLGKTPRDVYLVITNPQSSEASSYPSLGTTALQPDADQALVEAEAASLLEQDRARSRGEGLDCPQDVSLFNSDPWFFGNVTRDESTAFYATTATAAQSVAPVARDSVGDTEIFYDSSGNAMNATCRKVVDTGERILNLWVADNAWAGSGCNRARCLTPSQLDILAEHVLAPGADNDIHDWVTGIFGEEWGPHDYTNLIAEDGNITILLFDLSADNSTNGGLLGYFHSLNNFHRSAMASSNERVMFALDSVLFATEEGAGWDIGDRWPQRMLSTLAHEYQHMVHFYQKQVVYGGHSETWLDEMSAMVTQDLLASRMQVDGPRGVSWADGSAGGEGNHDGRLPRYNRYSYLPVAYWFNGSSGEQSNLNSYAVNYAFGAYLARNFGGAGFFRDLIQNSQGGTQAVDTALSLGGFSGEDFTSVLSKWGAAVLLSDRSATDVPEGYRYNFGGFLDASLEGIRYELGSINLFNYSGDVQGGPLVFTSFPETGMAGRYRTSNLLYRLGTGLSGVLTQELTLAEGTRMSVVVK